MHYEAYDGLEWKTGEVATCKFCGEEDLHWEDYGLGWRLYDEDDKKHVCSRTASPDDFDVV